MPRRPSRVSSSANGDLNEIGARTGFECGFQSRRDSGRSLLAGSNNEFEMRSWTYRRDCHSGDLWEAAAPFKNTCRVASERVPTLASAWRKERRAARDTPARSARSQKLLWVLAFHDSPNHSPCSHSIPEPNPDINQIPRYHKDQEKD